VLLFDALVLHGHAPTGEGNEPRAKSPVLVGE